MGLLNWIDELKCQHEYEYISEERGENVFGLIIYRRYYRCKKCLKIKYIDYTP